MNRKVATNPGGELIALILLWCSLLFLVLSTLLSKFKVTLADNVDEVYWNLAPVQYPTVGKESDRPEYPIKLTPIQA